MWRLLAVVLVLLASPVWAQTVGPQPINGADVSGSKTIPTSANMALTTAALAAQQGVLLDAFRLPTDADDTASLNRAVAAGVPILLGPRTYLMNNFNTGTVASFVLKGVKGKSVIQRNSGSTGTFFYIGGTTTSVDGVTFDMNSANVTGNQWGVRLSNGGQTISISNSTFMNNSGSLGSCLTLTSTGPSGGGSFNLSDNEFTGCPFNSLYLASVTNGVVARNYIHDNAGNGVFIASQGAASSTNLSSEILVSNNRFYRNHIGVAVGGISPPYSYSVVQAINTSVDHNMFEDNYKYSITLQGKYLSATRNIMQQSSPSVVVFGAMDVNSQYVHVSENIITQSQVYWGIDVGGSIDAVVSDNFVTTDFGVAYNGGGNFNSVFTNNKAILSGTAAGLTIAAIEADGSGSAFSTLTSGNVYDNNTFDMSGSSTSGVIIKDNAGGYPGAKPNTVRNNRFNVSGSGTGPAQDIIWYGSAGSVKIDGNTHNGANFVFIDPVANGDVIFDNVYLGGSIFGITSTLAIRSVETTTVANYGGGGSILYVTPTAGGAGYTAATTTLAASGSGGGSGWTGTAQIYGGAIIGVITNTFGTGYSGTITITATDSGGGTGATFSAGNVAVLPAASTLTYNSAASHILQISGAFIRLQTSSSLYMIAGTAVQLQAISGGNFWNVSGYQTPAVAIGSLLTCTGAQMTNVPVIVNSSVSGKWQARCNGTNWIAPDGTTIN